MIFNTLHLLFYYYYANGQVYHIPFIFESIFMYVCIEAVSNDCTLLHVTFIYCIWSQWWSITNIEARLQTRWIDVWIDFSSVFLIISLHDNNANSRINTKYQLASRFEMTESMCFLFSTMCDKDILFLLFDYNIGSIYMLHKNYIK